MKKAFTLIEIIIVLIIIGILSLVLTQAYITITKLSFTIEQEKNLTEESLMITQILQSISDTATIDYDEYNGELYKTN
ncbi:MAG: prepilin-type N-terminal cleavage/methylation domain-containing protein [Candidatus Peribacteria bacterium]|jgi:prepilin-type N-terminal cleavage/methylation domain-containing protein|nr:prepilin-type N-terminal cleavage/methylation domain-containing protein [Candidatus Peribacteria bacterium]